MDTNKYYILGFFILIAVFFTHAKSKDSIVARVGDEILYKSEFDYAYNKSNSGLTTKQTEAQFLKSYIDFKMKVLEAKRLKLDENINFNEEYNRYISDLKETYLKDTITIFNYAEMVYRRLHENIEVSELFIAYPNGIILPKDTLDTYNRAKRIKSELKSDNSNFTDLVKKYSNDSLTATSSRPGYVGWFSSLMLDPLLEDAIYDTPVNKVSEPIRTNYGYFLIKPLNKRPDKGQKLVSHILLHYKKTNPTQLERDSLLNLANTIYEDLQSGANFELLCSKYSDDLKTAQDGGKLGWVDIKNPLPAEFDEVLDKLNVGELSKPFEAPYGYHIFRIEDKQQLSSFKEIQEDLYELINKKRIDNLNFKELSNLRQKFPYEIKKSSYKKLEVLARKYIPNDSVFIEKASVFGDEILLEIDKRQYTVEDFLFYLQKNPSYRVRLSTDILNYALNYFIFDTLKGVKEESLMELYPELKNLAREYYEGLLLFDVINQVIWERSQTDKNELDSLYNLNPDKYKWDSPKYEGYLIYAKNEDIMNQAKQIIKTQPKSINIPVVLKEQLNVNGQLNVIIEKGFWSKGDNEYVDHILYNIPTNQQMIDYPKYFLEGKLIDKPRNFEDVRGQVISEYQAILENEWLQSLRKRYKVEINEDVLN